MSESSEAGSGIEGMRHDSAFARRVAAVLDEPFRLIDVGAAGGVAAGWRVFGDKLAALAYEADAAEAARLNAAEANPAVRYHAGFVGLPPEHPLRVRLGDRLRRHGDVSGRLSFERARIIKATRALGHQPLPIDRHFREIVPNEHAAPPADGYDTDYAAAFGTGPLALPAVTRVEGEPDLIYLPEHVRAADFENADFLKIDVDGPDFEILRTSGDLLSRPGLLGAALEVTFVGSHDANDNSFHNMDRLMRAKGFGLFGLTVRKYASAALPSPFMDRHPGPTYQGRPFQGDAIYLRDLASPSCRAEAAAVSDDKLLKLAALFSLFELPDQAAELLLVHRDRLAERLDPTEALDLLTAQAQEPWPRAIDFAEWTRLFEAGDRSFYDVYGARDAWMRGLVQAQAEAEAATRRAEAAEAALKALEAQGKHLIDSEITLRAIRTSTLWRALGPVRAAIEGVRRVLRGSAT